jgi:isopenicillin N synthase-like dioxygenase
MVKSSIDSLPPFPSGLPLAPIARISSRKLLDGDAAEGKQVLEACQTYGFFYLDLSDSPEGEALLEESEQLLTLSERSFDSPKEEKMKFELQKGVSMFGYKAAGTVKKTDKELRPDTTEFWNISKVLCFALPRSQTISITLILGSHARDCADENLPASTRRFEAAAQGLHEECARVCYADVADAGHPAGPAQRDICRAQHL